MAHVVAHVQHLIPLTERSTVNPNPRTGQHVAYVPTGDPRDDGTGVDYPYDLADHLEVIRETGAAAERVALDLATLWNAWAQTLAAVLDTMPGLAPDALYWASSEVGCHASVSPPQRQAERDTMARMLGGVVASAAVRRFEAEQLARTISTRYHTDLLNAARDAGEVEPHDGATGGSQTFTWTLPGE